MDKKTFADLVVPKSPYERMEERIMALVAKETDSGKTVQEALTAVHEMLLREHKKLDRKTLKREASSSFEVDLYRTGTMKGYEVAMGVIGDMLDKLHRLNKTKEDGNNGPVRQQW